MVQIYDKKQKKYHTLLIKCDTFLLLVFFISIFMISNESLHRALHYLSYVETFCFSSLCQL